MIDNLEEKIKHLEKVAEELEEEAIKGVVMIHKLNKCIDCAKEHRQLAEWLRELKGYREARQELEERHAVGTLDLIDRYIEEAKADV